MRFSRTILFWIVFLPLHVLSQEIKSGEVERLVKCANDTSQTYALYIPSYYDDSEEWPIVYVFEPAARGFLPVEKYAGVAEDLGFIIVSSNNSRNGSWEVGFDAADAMFLDTQNKLSIDKKRVFTSGFSGGSRLALSIAVITKRIRGVIGVGAAQPPKSNYRMNENADFLYAGLVGHKDMNYQEHKLMSKTLDEWGKNNLLLVSELGHQWAEVLDFKIAMEWMLLNTGEDGMKSMLVSSLQEKLNTFSDSVSQIDVALTKSYLEGDSPKVDGKQIKEEQKLFKKEVNLRLQFGDSLDKAMNEKDRQTKKWVLNFIQSMKNQKARSKKINKSLMHARVLDYIRAASYETGFRLMNQKRYNEALVCVDIWSELQGNLRVKYWWYAKVFAMQGNNQACIDQLEMLVAEGFNKVDMLETEKAFDGIRSMSSYNQILSRAKNNGKMNE